MDSKEIADIRREGTDLSDVTDEELEKKITEGDDLFADEETDTPEDSQSENKEEAEESPDSDGEEPDEGEDGSKEDDSSDEDKEDDDSSVPFHKHPRFKELIDEKNTLKDSLEAAMSEINKLKEPKENPEEIPKIPDWFSRIFGDSEEAWQNYYEQTKREKEEIVKTVFSALEKRQEKVKEEETKWNQWVDSEVKRLEESGEEFDRKELLKIMVDYTPSDNSGNLDFDKGLKLYKQLGNKKQAEKKELDDKKKETNSVRKKIADTTVSKSKKDTSKDGIVSFGDVRFKSFDQLADE